MKLLIVALVWLSSPVLIADTIKLVCDVTAKERTSSEKAADERGRAFVDIAEVGADLYVFIRSEVSSIDNFTVGTVVTNDSKRMSAGKNLSTKDKWEITESSARKKDGVIDTVTESRLFIDRTTGLIVLSSEFTVSGGQLFMSATGSCKKAASDRLF